MDSLASRMKSYEDSTRLPKGGVIIRVDGKVFHTWTKVNGFEKPFDMGIVGAMNVATYKTCLRMQNFRLAYVQSDEASFVLTNFGENEGAWFDYKVQKLVSVTASIFTHEFNQVISGLDREVSSATFDARAFSVPKFDIANNIVWRFQDNQRNWPQAVGHYYFSHKELQGKSNKEVLKMLADLGVDVTQYPESVRLGSTFFKREDGNIEFSYKTLTYDEVNNLIGIEKPGAWGDDAYRKYEDLEEIYFDEEDELQFAVENDCN